MIIIEDNIFINASPDRIFVLLTTQLYRKQWEPTLVDERISPVENLRVGTRLFQVRRFLGGNIEIQFVVTEYEQGKRYELQSPPESRPSYTSTYVLETENGGTRVRFSSIVDPRGLLIVTLLLPIIRVLVTREVALLLSALKKAAEAG